MDWNASAALEPNQVEQLVFGWIDYGLFGGLIGISLLIGIYFGFCSKQNSTSEYLFGGKSMNYVPVAISILASFLSGITYLGVPTEVYLQGSQYLVSITAVLLIGLISAYVTMPIFHKLQLSSCYEYLELRFSKTTKTFASILYIISLFMNIPIIVYVPALAFSQVTGYNVHAITPVFCIVCIIYTSMGGIKAVVWTDSVQFAFTVGGLVTVLVLGVNTVGGFSEVWRIAEEGHRIKMFDMDPNPLRRDTFWAMSVGMTFSLLIRFGLGQKFVQRFLAIKREEDLRKAIFMISIGWSLIQVGCVFTGLIMFARYYGCDPLKAKLISRSDQTLPYYVMDIARDIRGLPGVFLAGLVSSALSTLSAALNTLSGMIYEICIDRWVPDSPNKDAIATNIMKGISVLAGVITIGLIFIVEHLGTVFEVATSLASGTEGALLGLFLLGLLFPWVGKKGAIAGASFSLVIMSWFIGQTQWYILSGKICYPTLTTSTSNCTPSLLNQTFIDTTTKLPSQSSDDEPLVIFRISMVYFTLIGATIAVVVGVITSYFTSETDLSKVNPDHIVPFLRRILPNQKFYTGIPLKDVNTGNIIPDDKIKKNGNANNIK